MRWPPPRIPPRPSLIPPEFTVEVCGVVAGAGVGAGFCAHAAIATIPLAAIIAVNLIFIDSSIDVSCGCT
jgi:hypothetical protein